MVRTQVRAGCRAAGAGAWRQHHQPGRMAAQLRGAGARGLLPQSSGAARGQAGERGRRFGAAQGERSGIGGAGDGAVGRAGADRERGGAIAAPRHPATGLDCVGLAALALRTGGAGISVPSGYALRHGDVAHIAGAIEAAGLVPVADPRPGDLLLLRAGPGQLHFAIQTQDGMIHADAMLRRVVERREIPWPVIGRWRGGGD
jgi:hypothetical protein